MLSKQCDIIINFELIDFQNYPIFSFAGHFRTRHLLTVESDDDVCFVVDQHA